jgi:Cu-processing system permease protein
MTMIFSLIRDTFLQQLRKKLYLVVLLYAGVMAAASLIFGAVAADAEATVILDLGLAGTELFGLLAAVMSAVTLVLDEMDSRTVYLILTRPVSREIYVVGRYLGLVSAVIAGMAVMGLSHLGLMLLKGWAPGLAFFACFPFMFLKVALMTALALFFSLFSTSQASSVVFSLFFWLLGHFGAEISFLSEKAPNAVAGMGLKVFSLVLPRFDLLNFRDLLDAPGLAAGPLLARGGAYAGLYTGACLVLSLTLFSRKEF